MDYAFLPLLHHHGSDMRGEPAPDLTPLLMMPQELAVATEGVEDALH